MFSQQSYSPDPRFNAKHSRTHPQNQSTNRGAIESARGPAPSPRTPTARSQSAPASKRRGAGIQKDRGRERRSHFNAAQRIDEYSLQGFPFLMALGWVEPWPVPSMRFKLAVWTVAWKMPAKQDSSSISPTILFLFIGINLNKSDINSFRLHTVTTVSLHEISPLLDLFFLAQENKDSMFSVSLSVCPMFALFTGECWVQGLKTSG